MAKVEELSDKDFDEKVLKNPGKVMVDFFAPWCGPCQAMGPILEEASGEIKNDSKIFKVNVDEQADLAGQYSVMSIPTIYIFKDGKVLDQMVGVHSKEDLLKKLS